MNPQMDTLEIWNTTIAWDLIGKVLLVGISYFAADGLFTEQKQFYGKVTSAGRDQGIVLALEGSPLGEQFALTIDTRSVSYAAVGEYRLRSTDEVVINPDFTATYNVHSNASPS